MIAPEVLFLFDGSGSMAREDGYVGDDEARDAVRALTGESADSVSRIELAEAVRPRLLSAAREAGYVPRACASRTTSRRWPTARASTRAARPPPSATRSAAPSRAPAAAT